MPCESVHKRRSLRLKGYDYDEAGAYFVTIVAEGRLCVFGRIVDQHMRPNEAGRMVQEAWQALTGRFATIEAGSFVLMPNHVHGILVLHDPADVGAGLVPALEARAATGPLWHGRPQGPPLLGQIVGAFKSITTLRYAKGVRESGWAPFERRLWQRNYYDRIIRDAQEWNRIQLYIESNPAQWLQDEERPARGS